MPSPARTQNPSSSGPSVTKRIDHALHAGGVRGAAVEKDYAADAAHRLNDAPALARTGWHALASRFPSQRERRGCARPRAALRSPSPRSSSSLPYNGPAAGSQTNERYVTGARTAVPKDRRLVVGASWHDDV